jgi:hypothetical protein
MRSQEPPLGIQEGPDFSLALHREKFIDFWYRATHEMKVNRTQSSPRATGAMDEILRLGYAAASHRHRTPTSFA